MNLQLSLKKKWFEMTKAGIKTEDYREITDYWCRRLFHFNREIEMGSWFEFIDELSTEGTNLINLLDRNDAKFKPFTQNTMTLGYPKSTDSGRTLKLEHRGIEIRTGNTEWGAEEGKLYFVIKHGKIINEQ